MHIEKTPFGILKTACCIAAILLSLLTFIALSCEVMHMSQEIWGVKIGYGLNGYQIIGAFSDLYNDIHSGSAIFCVLMCYLLLFYAIGLIVWAVSTFFLVKKAEKSKSIFITFSSLVGTTIVLYLLYMIAGIAFVSNFHGVQGTSTLTWIPFVLSLLLAGGWFFLIVKCKKSHILEKLVTGGQCEAQEEAQHNSPVTHGKAETGMTEEKSIELLLKYKELYEQEIISKEEFEEKKHTLLNL